MNLSRKGLLVGLAAGLMTGSATGDEDYVSLFDGESLEGWTIREGEEQWWRVQDGAITGGSLEKKVPHNTFLTWKNSYGDFDLRFKIRLVKGEGGGFLNSGIQVRSQRIPDHHEMIGYQADAGIKWWGKIYDESRRRKVIGDWIDPKAAKAAAHDWDQWNDYRILCEGPRIRTWINGVAMADYVEKDAEIPLEGLIGLQAHGGGKFLVQFKEIRILEDKAAE
jgi:hypothetical protein